jgi:aspartate/methionine/tyrosine aminotransferase
MNFSRLALEFTGETHPLYALRDEMVSNGEAIVDLVRGNVTEHGLSFPPDILAEIQRESIDKSSIYRADPFGQLDARKAIRKYYLECGLDLAAERMLLTPGTSVSYWYCFKLLAEAGDEILSPTPSYPLLDYIAKLCDVSLRYYKLDETRDWAIDFDYLSAQINSKTRAIVLISPHNPTGMVCSEKDIMTLAEIASEHELPIISDEVFGEFLYSLDRLPRPAGSSAPLVFTLNGFSKSFALPGLKLGWIAVSGDESLVKRSLAALEMISDTFLPVSEYVQASVPQIFERGKDFQRRYVSAIANLRARTMEVLAGSRFIAPSGGFYLTLPIRGDEEEVALSLLREHRILTHPGHFYEIEGNHLVATFIQKEAILIQCMQKIRELIA